MANQVFDKQKKAQIRNELDQLLNNYSKDPNFPEESIMDEELGEIAAAPPIDFDRMNSEFEAQAKNITKSMLKFYVDLGVIDQSEYIDQKRKLDNSNIQNIFFQLKTLRMALEKITEEINQGNTHPRLFEVFGQLQDKLTTVIKTQANYVLFLEDTYKKLNQELNQKNVQPSTQVTPLIGAPGEYYISAGTKNVMRTVSEEEDDAEVKAETDTRHLTHPSKKLQVMEEKGIPHEQHAEETFEDLQDEMNSII